MLGRLVALVIGIPLDAALRVVERLAGGEACAECQAPVTVAGCDHQSWCERSGGGSW